MVVCFNKHSFVSFTRMLLALECLLASWLLILMVSTRGGRQYIIPFVCATIVSESLLMGFLACWIIVSVMPHGRQNGHHV